MVLNMCKCKYVVQFRNMINPYEEHDLQKCVLSIKKYFDIVY